MNTNEKIHKRADAQYQPPCAEEISLVSTRQMLEGSPLETPTMGEGWGW